MDIKEYTENNINDISRLIDEIKTEDVENNEYDPDLKNIKHYQETYFNDQKNKTFLASYTDNIVGFIIGGEKDSETFEIYMHYVSKNYRKKGIAKKLEETITEYARTHNYKEIHSDVLKTNTESIRLNINAGWDKQVFPEFYRFVKKLCKNEDTIAA